MRSNHTSCVMANLDVLPVNACVTNFLWGTNSEPNAPHPHPTVRRSTIPSVKAILKWHKYLVLSERQELTVNMRLPQYFFLFWHCKLLSAYYHTDNISLPWNRPATTALKYHKIQPRQGQVPPIYSTTAHSEESRTRLILFCLLL